MSYCVSLPYDPAWPEAEWINANCPSYITNTARKQTHYTNDPVTDELVIDYEYVIDYYFSDERDAAMFILRWK